MASESRSPVLLRLFVLLTPLALLLTGCGGPNLVERITQPRWGCCGTLYIILAVVAIIDLLGDEARDTTSRTVWVLLIVFFPLGGAILYLLFGRE